MKAYRRFCDFYPFYLSEHSDKRNRRMHFLASWLVLGVLACALATHLWLLALAPFAGYGPAWIGHYVFERNRPATFQYPIYSFMGDWVMFWQILTGRLAL